MAQNEHGAQIEVRDVNGRPLVRRALTGVVDGPGRPDVPDFPDLPVVWACPEKEWEAAQAEGREPEGVPWPAQNVRPLE
jgi:hypothetical protein